ncbi:alpha/beta hydrolase [Xylocopilactobacillus apicola]|uniref:Esterase n=1 Tax=Xylocopilactobacillus apicola TaxID=2932184 RepID=A0AAU9DPF5_9LACO|nr:alpha/beta hydrolase [Xylocopilactobacillus apicola]BDR59037.1 esterase [Xylocopilactobacillus apicola]
MKFSKDLEYEKEHHLKLDLYQNDAKNKVKMSLIIIHGGGWFRGSKDSETELATKFVTLGYDVVVPDYRLAPPNFYPAPQEDINQAYQWTKSQFPTNEIAVLGTSVGGTMAVELAIKYGIPAVSLSGIFDLEKWIRKHQSVEPVLEALKSDDPEEQLKLNEQFYKGFILNYLGQNLDLLKKATPYYRVSSTTGPVFLLNSMDELAPVSGVLKMEKSLAKHGVLSWVHFLAGTRHGHSYALEVTASVDQFLKQKNG